jgi:ubiquinone/menaquinone biosynthesis C-methylase UbiE
MREIARVLKPGGVLIATMLNERSPYRAWQSHGYWKFQNGIKKLFRLIKGMGHRKEGPIRRGEKRKRPESKLYSEEAFRHLITSEGIEVEDVLYYDFNLFLSPLDVRFPKISVFLSRKLEPLCRSKLKCLGTGFILKCRKN